MILELTENEARFLHAQLVLHTREVDVELAHTEKRELQRALAHDLAELQAIAGRLEGLLKH